MELWNAPVATAPMQAVVTIPGSKSMTNRALILAALAVNPSKIVGALRSRDSELMLAALTALGTKIVDQGQVIQVTPGRLRGATIDCGLAGTVMRFLPPVAALAQGSVIFDGDPYARKRPMTTMCEALRLLGADIIGDHLPLTVAGTGRIRGGAVTIDASASSQFVSGLLLSGSRFDQGVTVTHHGGPLPSMPHIEMTIDMLAYAGVNVTTTPGKNGDFTWEVAPAPILGRTWQIEPDLSNATPFLAAAAVTGGTVTIPNWPAKTTQPGDSIRGIFEQMGATVQYQADPAALTVTGPAGGKLRGITMDCSDIGELTPTIAAMATLATTPTRLTGIAHLRGHETDRLKALVTEINKIGGCATELPDGLEIHPSATGLHGATWASYDDHRMATAGAIIGLTVPNMQVENIATTAKTLPHFPELWAGMLGQAHNG